MARFYQTAQRNFIDDFIFQPNWEMAAMALQKTDTEIKDQLDTLDLFNNLPVDYWSQADKNNVNQIKDEYSSRVDELTKQMQGDLTNTGNNRYLINQLRKDIERDYETGRLKQIQDNAQAYKEFTEKLKALPNPADRQAYMGAVNEYLANNEQGALSGLFKAPEMHNMQDVWKGFTESAGFKALKPEEIGSEITNSNGRYLITQGKDTKELSESKIGQAFSAYLSGANLQGYAADRQKYHGQQWLNESGNYRFDEGSYLGNIIKTGIPSLAYKNETTTKGMTTDQYGVLDAQEAKEIRAEKRQQAYAQALARVEANQQTSADASFAYNLSSKVLDDVQTELSSLGKKYGLKINTNDLDVLTKYAKDNKLNSFGNEIQKLKNQYQEGIRASYQPLADTFGFSSKQVEAYKDNIRKEIVNKGYSTPGWVDLAGSGLGATKMSKKLSLNEMKGKEINGKKVANVKYVKDSSIPVFLSSSEKNNFIQSNVVIDFEDESSVVVPYYQPSSALTGNNIIQTDIKFNY